MPDIPAGYQESPTGWIGPNGEWIDNPNFYQGQTLASFRPELGQELPPDLPQQLGDPFSGTQFVQFPSATAGTGQPPAPPGNPLEGMVGYRQVFPQNDPSQRFGGFMVPGQQGLGRFPSFYELMQALYARGYRARGGSVGPTKSKSEARYRDSPHLLDRCSKCSMFRKPGSCTLVQGKISPHGWCRYFKGR